MVLFSALQATVLEEARSYLPTAFPLFFFQRAMSVFKTPYLYYRSFRFLSLIRGPQGKINKDSVWKAEAMNSIKYLSHGDLILKTILAAKCAGDILQDYQKLGDCYQQLQKTFYWRYPIYESIKKKEIGALPPWLLLQKKQLQGVIRQIGKVSRAMTDVLFQGFRLSTRFYEVYLLLSGDEQVQFDGCLELIADWSRYQEQLVNGCISFGERIFTRADKEAKIEGTIRSSLDEISGIVFKTLKKPLDFIQGSTSS